MTAEYPNGDPDDKMTVRVSCSFTDPVRGFTGAGTMLCSLPSPLAAGYAYTVRYELTSTSRGERVNEAVVTTPSRERTTDNNTARFEVTFVDDRSEVDVRALRRLERERKGAVTGTAEAAPPSQRRARPVLARTAQVRARVAKVEVALVRRVGRRCLWLRTARARFVRRRAVNGKCERQVWLRARGTTRWAYRIRRRLPRGRYVLYSRATDAAGVSEAVFTSRRRNRFALRLR